MAYQDRISDIARCDVDVLRVKDAEYGGSWLRRGGIGAAMMALRKVDRLEVILKRHGYDVFAAVAKSGSDTEPLLETIRDLRRYLILIEAEALEQARVKTQPGESGDQLISVSIPVAGRLVLDQVDVVTPPEPASASDGSGEVTPSAPPLHASGGSSRARHAIPPDAERVHPPCDGQEHPFGFDPVEDLPF